MNGEWDDERGVLEGITLEYRIMNNRTFEQSNNRSERGMMNKKKISLLVGILLLLLTMACDVGSDPLNWLYNDISNMENGTGDQCVGSIWRYDYNGGEVYYFRTRCADGISILYNSNGYEIGAEGGYVGIQTGVIVDFHENRENGVLIWALEEE